MYDDPLDPYAPMLVGEPEDWPPDNGWWEFIDGVWRWITRPVPSVSTD